jgi:hypothetical protein
MRTAFIFPIPLIFKPKISATDNFENFCKLFCAATERVDNLASF